MKLAFRKSSSTTSRATRFKRRWLMRLGIFIVASFYTVALFADFIAPHDYREQSRREPLMPPARIHFRDAGGTWHARPFIYRRKLVDALTRRYVEDTNQRYDLCIFPISAPYKLVGIFNARHRLFGVDDVPNASRLNLLGTDALGRDRFSRLIIAARFSLIVAPLGTLFASLIGVFIGGIAGYANRLLDAVLMRLCDTVIALPTLILILAARASLPLELSPSRAGVLLVVIFAALGWAEIAVLTRNLVVTLREREYVLAAQASGVRPTRILFRHILPNAAHPIIVQTMLMLPVFLLAETALSYFGAGLQEPAPSWGNMLAAASDATLLRAQPLVTLTPAFAIMLFVFGVRIVGEELKNSG